MVCMKACAWQMRNVAILMFVALVGIASSEDVSSEILFQDDFERLEINLDAWAPQVSWGIEDNDTRHDVLGRKVLGVWGGGAGLHLTNFPEEFDYYADFNAKNGGSLGISFSTRRTTSTSTCTRSQLLVLSTHHNTSDGI